MTTIDGAAVGTLRGDGGERRHPTARLMSRGILDDLVNPLPIGLQLPGLYHDDDLTQRFTSALDVVLAPTISTLDNLDAYLDPHLAPADFLAWLSQWVGAVLDDDMGEARHRELVARAVELYRWRGTEKGIRDLLEVALGVECEIEQNGGAAWSPTPQGSFPGDPEPRLAVRVRAPADRTIDLTHLNLMISASKPAHVPHTVEVVPA